MSDIRSGVGLRHVQVLALASDGYPDATDTSAYDGIQISGAQSFEIDDPEPRQIVHLGDDSIIQMDYLPPEDPITGNLTVGKTNDDVDAVLTDTKQVTEGNIKLFGFGTDNRGDENQVIVLAFQQSLNTDPDSSSFGERRWEAKLFPRAYVVPAESGFTSDPEERSYSLWPQFVNSHAWGVDFAEGTEGFNRAQGVRMVSEYKPKLSSWQGDNAETEFDFPADYPAVSASSITVWVDGTEQTADMTAATDQLTFASTAIPTTDANIVALYEYE